MVNLIFVFNIVSFFSGVSPAQAYALVLLVGRVGWGCFSLRFKSYQAKKIEEILGGIGG